MGQSKYNPTAIAAKNGELTPKHKGLPKREVERRIMQEISNKLHSTLFAPIQDADELEFAKDTFDRLAESYSKKVYDD